MSAERKTSKGAPFWICAKKLPDEPMLVFNVAPVWELVNSRFSSSRQNTRSDAAAMPTFAGAAGARSQSAASPNDAETRARTSGEDGLITASVWPQDQIR